MLVAENPDSVRGADVAVFSFDRVPGDYPPDDYRVAAPEVAAEIMSRSDRWADVFDKIGRYLKFGVVAVVIVEPEIKRVRVFRPDGTDVPVRAGDRLVLPEIRPAFEADVGDLFAHRRNRKDRLKP